MDNERRADLGQDSVRAAAFKTNAWNTEDAETAICDVMAYIMHYADRCGLSQKQLLARSQSCYQGDFEDGPKAKACINPGLPLASSEKKYN